MSSEYGLRVRTPVGDGVVGRGGGALPLADIHHAPVNRHPFLHQFVVLLNAPLSQLYTQ